MQTLLIEGAINVYRAYIEANIDEKLTSLMEEYDDNIDLPTPAAFYMGELSLEQVPQWPAMFFLGRQTNIQRYNFNFTDANYEFDIGIVLLEQSAEDIQIKMYRYTRAIWELVVEREAASNPSEYFTVGQPAISYSHTISRDAAGPFVADAILSLTVNKQEDS